MVLILEEIHKHSGIKGSRLLNFLAPLTENRTKPPVITDVFRSCDLNALQPGTVSGLVNLHRVNNIKGINCFFRKANEILEEGAIFAGCAETLEQRRSRLLHKYPRFFNLFYYTADFVFKRIFPKFNFTKRIYLSVTGGRNRALSKSEVLGRLVYCGFKIESVEEFNHLMYFKARKVGRPLNEPEPSSGILLRINRIGHHGRPITVYKFRTMHPYAQYIQAYVYEQFQLKPGGKFSNDFRITKWGRWMRRFWIDEIPMVYNILRGDLKIIGVRPLSEHYLNLYTPEHAVLRTQGKPGLIPPFYADMPVSLEEIMASEQRYIQAYMQQPLATDMQYAARAVGNILFRKARSQ